MKQTLVAQFHLVVHDRGLLGDEVEVVHDLPGQRHLRGLGAGQPRLRQPQLELPDLLPHGQLAAGGPAVVGQPGLGQGLAGAGGG